MKVMKIFKKIYSLLAIALVGLSLAACSEDNLDTNQYKGGVSLNAYGPNPVMRGGVLRFVGSNLDQVASVQIPGVSPITNYEVIKAGVPSEIRVTVPKDGPEVGIVSLTTKDNQTLVTQSELTYSEPIEFEGFSPASVMPGDVVTIKGDYLNLIYSLAFADGVIVSENDFLSHDRYTITVAVPEDAKTGKIELYTTDLTVQEEEELEYQIIIADEAIEIGLPAVTKLKGRNEVDALGTITAKAGESISITGTYFNVADDVTIGGVSAADLKISNDGTGIVFTLPETAPDGDIEIVCKSGVEVPVGKLTTVKPSECVATPKPVKAGSELRIDGKDMDLVTDVEFADAKGEYTITGNANIIKTKEAYAVTVPETAVDGNLKLVMANGSRIEVPFTLVKPTATGYDKTTVSAGGTLTIKGTDLDLVNTVLFGEGSDLVEVKDATAESITLTVPMNAKSGAPTLTLANGKVVEDVPSITVDEAVFCYITLLPTDDNKPSAGDMLIAPVRNGDKLTNVFVNGTEVRFIYNEKNADVAISIPSNAKATSTLRLVSSNGEIEYEIPVLPNTEIYTTIWAGSWQCAGWAGNQDLAWGGYDWSSVTAGTMLEIHLAKTTQGQWGCISLRHGDSWGALPAPIPGQYDLEDGDVVLSITLSQPIIDDLAAKGGLVLTGDNYTLSKVVLHEHIDLETTIWTGPWTCAGWGGNQDLAWGAFDWSTIKTNSIMRFYYQKTDPSAWGCISLRHGDSWGALPAPIPGQYDLPEAEGFIEVVFTADILADLINNGGLVMTGDNYTLVKVTYE